MEGESGRLDPDLVVLRDEKAALGEERARDGF